MTGETLKAAASRPRASAKLPAPSAIVPDSSRQAVQAAVFLVVIAVLDIPRYVIDVFALPLPLLGGNPPYLMPFCMVIGFILLKFSFAAIDGEDLFFMSCLYLWSLLEIFHGARAGHMRWELVAVNVWCYLGYFVLKQLGRFTDIRETLVAACLLVTGTISLIHTAMLALLRLPGIPATQYLVGSELLDRNGISFMALLGFHLILFYPDCLKRLSGWRWKYGLAGSYVLVIMLNRTRGAMLVFAMLAAGRALLYGSALKRILAAALLLALGGVLLAGDGMERVSSRLAIVKAGLDYRTATADDYEMFSWDNAEVSAYSRVRTNLLCIQSFLANPFIGIGLAESFGLRIAGYMSHTYFLLVACAYGAIGSIPYLLFFKGLACPANRPIPKRSILTLFLIVGILTFINDFPSWFAVPFFLLKEDAAATAPPANPD
jgi:hypothetical protein